MNILSCKIYNGIFPLSILKKSSMSANPTHCNRYFLPHMTSYDNSDAFKSVSPVKPFKVAWKQCYQISMKFQGRATLYISCVNLNIFFLIILIWPPYEVNHETKYKCKE